MSEHKVIKITTELKANTEAELMLDIGDLGKMIIQAGTTQKIAEKSMLLIFLFVTLQLFSKAFKSQIIAGIQMSKMCKDYASGAMLNKSLTDEDLAYLSKNLTTFKKL